MSFNKVTPSPSPKVSNIPRVNRPGTTEINGSFPTTHSTDIFSAEFLSRLSTDAMIAAAGDINAEICTKVEVIPVECQSEREFLARQLDNSERTIAQRYHPALWNMYNQQKARNVTGKHVANFLRRHSSAQVLDMCNNRDPRRITASRYGCVWTYDERNHAIVAIIRIVTRPPHNKSVIYHRFRPSLEGISLMYSPAS
jgi:hypothetical protein